MFLIHLIKEKNVVLLDRRLSVALSALLSAIVACVIVFVPSKAQAEMARWVNQNLPKDFFIFIAEADDPLMGIQKGDLLYAKRKLDDTFDSVRKRNKTFTGVMHFPAFKWHPGWKIIQRYSPENDTREYVLQMGREQLSAISYGDKVDIGVSRLRHWDPDHPDKVARFLRVIDRNPGLLAPQYTEIDDDRYAGMGRTVAIDRPNPGLVNYEDWSLWENYPVSAYIPEIGIRTYIGSNPCEYAYPLRAIGILNDDDTLRWRKHYMVETRPRVKRPKECAPLDSLIPASEVGLYTKSIRDEYLLLRVEWSPRDRRGVIMLDARTGNVVASNRRVWVADDEAVMAAQRLINQPPPSESRTCWTGGDATATHLNLDRSIPIGNCVLKQLINTYLPVEFKHGN